MKASPVQTASWRRTNLGHLLFAATGLSIAHKLAVVHAAGYAEMTDAQLTLFEHLDPEGARLTTLAAHAGLTKQSMIELIDRAEAADFVERLADPEDGRAKIVRLTRRGLDLSHVVSRAMQEAEQAFAPAPGTAHRDQVDQALSALAPKVEGVGGLERQLSAATGRFARDVLSEVHRHGYLEVTEALISLFRTLELHGSRLTDVAAAARITKQSMRVLVERAEHLGLIEREPDLSDRRAKTIHFSYAGLAMLEEMRRGVEKAEAHFADRAGVEALDLLKTTLSRYLATSPSD